MTGWWFWLVRKRKTAECLESIIGEVELTTRRATGGAMRKIGVGSERTTEVVLWAMRADYLTVGAETY